MTKNETFLNTCWNPCRNRLRVTLFLALERVYDALDTPKVSVVQTEDTVRTVKTQQRTPLKQKTIQKSDDKISSDADDFYQVIIENNIFRPLNWKPTQQEPAYILLGTATTEDSSTATAYITDRKTHQFYAVKVGEKIVDATVTEILPKQITLEKGGKTSNLYMASVPFLSRTHSNRSSSYPSLSPQPHVTSQRRNLSTRSAKDKERQAWRDAQKERIAELKEMAEKLRAVSAEERRRMREHLERGNSR